MALRHTCTSPASSLGYGCRLSQKSAWLPGSHGPTPWLALPRSCQVAGVAVRRAPVWGVAQPANREPWLVACVLRGNPLPSCKQPQIASRKSRHCFVRAHNYQLLFLISIYTHAAAGAGLGRSVHTRRPPPGCVVLDTGHAHPLDASVDACIIPPMVYGHPTAATLPCESRAWIQFCRCPSSECREVGWRRYHTECVACTCSEVVRHYAHSDRML